MEISISETPLLRSDNSNQFWQAAPFPVLVFDDFLPESIADGLLCEISGISGAKKSNDYFFAKNKFESPNLSELGPYGQAIKRFFLSSEFEKALSEFFGKKLIIDADFVGGGVHRGGEGSFLDMHADFNVHPIKGNWLRELNILLYLNKGWRVEYGGELELRHALNGDSRSIEPIFNRLVIMLTKDFTLHGYNPIDFPAGDFRTSIAAYAYSELTGDVDRGKLRTTTFWAPEGGGTAKSLLARITPRLVTLKQRFFGSNTARRK